MGKVQSQMATEIALNTLQATESIKALTNIVSQATSAWKVQETQLKSTGNATEAIKAKFNGLGSAIEMQKKKIEVLRNEQSKLDVKTEESANAYLKYEKNINAATMKLQSMEAQQNRTKSSLTYYTSGLANLQKAYKDNSALSASFVKKLEAEGNQQAANVAKLKGLKQAGQNLLKQYELQEKELKKITETTGKNSDAYRKQIIRLNETEAAIYKTNNAVLKLEKTTARHIKIPFLDGLKTKLTNIRHEARQTGGMFKSMFLANMASNAAIGALGAIKSKLGEVMASGNEFLKYEDTMNASWLTLTGNADEGNKLVNMVNDLAISSQNSTQMVDGLAKQFYAVTDNADKTKDLSKAVLTLQDAFGVSDEAVKNFSVQYAQMLGNGSVHARDFLSFNSVFPKLKENLLEYEKQLTNNTNLSMGDIDQMMEKGKISAEDMNKVLLSMQDKYKDATKNFSSTLPGFERTIKATMPRLISEVEKPFYQMKNPIVGGLAKGLTAKKTQKEFGKLGETLAKQVDLIIKAFSPKGKKFDGVDFMTKAVENLRAIITRVGQSIVKHKTEIKDFFTIFKQISSTALKVFLNVLQTLLPVIKVSSRELSKHPKILSRVVAGMIAYKTSVKLLSPVIRTTVLAISSLGQTFKKAALFMKANPLIAITTAVIALGFALYELYKHNKQFRDFVNGIIRGAKKLANEIGKWIDKAWRKVKKGLDLIAKGTDMTFKAIGKYWDNLYKGTSKTVKIMFKTVTDEFKDGYKIIQDTTKIFSDLFSGKWKNLNKDFQNTIKDLKKFATRLFTDLFNILNNITSGSLGNMVHFFKDKFESIKSVISRARTDVHHKFVDIMRSIIKPFNAMLNGLKDGINWILEKVGASRIGGSWSVPMPSYAKGTKDTHKGGLALVNDGQGSNFREMYRLPNGEVGMFPNKRNMIVPLPEGTSILDGNRSALLAKRLGLPMYAGGIGKFFGDIFNKGKDLIDDAEKILKSPMSFLSSVFRKFTSGLGGKGFIKDIIVKFPETLAKLAIKWVKKMFEDFGSADNPGGSGVARWIPVIKKAAARMHVKLTEGGLNAVLRRIRQESNGNASVVNNWDSNAQAGTPSKGLLQYIQPTLSAWVPKGVKPNLGSGYTQLLALFNDSNWLRDISVSGGWGPTGHRRMANGGFISNHQMIEIAEGNKPEAVIPLDRLKSSRAWELVGKVTAQLMTHDGTLNGKDVKNVELKELSDKFDNMILLLQQLVGVNGAQLSAIKANGNRKDMYNEMALQQKMINYQSI